MIDLSGKRALVTGGSRGIDGAIALASRAVNHVQPGSTSTDANPADGDAAEFQRSMTSLGRYAEPREIAHAVVFLASPAASVITGAVLNADAGALA